MNRINNIKDLRVLMLQKLSFNNHILNAVIRIYYIFRGAHRRGGGGVAAECAMYSFWGGFKNLF